MVLAALLHVLVTLVALSVGIMLVFRSAPGDPGDALEEMLAEGLMIAVLLPAYLLGRLGFGTWPSDLLLALTLSTIGWCIIVYLVIVLVRSLRHRRRS